MDMMKSLQVFTKVVDVGSFSAAAKDLGMAPSMVGNHIRGLEQRMSGALLVRTTRRQTLTDLGEQALAQARVVLQGLADFDRLAEDHDKPKGVLRISAPLGLGRLHVAPALQRLRQDHPELQVELRLSDNPEDLVAAGLDLVVRNGPLVGNETSLVARTIAQQSLWLTASPAYLTKVSEPKSLTEIERHQTLRYSRNGRPRAWLFPTPAGLVQIDPPTSFMVDDVETLRDATAEGLGISWLPDWLVAPLIRRGTLKRLLKTQPAFSIPTYVIRPALKFPPARTLVAARFLSESLEVSIAREVHGGSAGLTRTDDKSTVGR